MIVRALSYIFCMIILPIALGLIWKKGIVYAFLLGHFTIMAIFQLIAVPSILLKVSFGKMSLIFWLFCIFLALLFLGHLTINRSWREVIPDKGEKRSSPGIWYGAILMIAFQAFFVMCNTNKNNDDARYVASAIEAYESDTMLINNPATGEEMGEWTNEIEKDVTSPWCIYYASISWLTKIHPAIIMHTLIPVFWIIVYYYIFFLIAKNVLDYTISQYSSFLLILSILNIVGLSSRSSNTFLMLRNWQGKSLVVSVIIPMIFYLLGIVYKEGMDFSRWICFFLVMMAGCLCSGVGIFVNILLVGSGALLIAILVKDWKVILKVGILCLPNIVYGLIYALIR